MLTLDKAKMACWARRYPPGHRKRFALPRPPTNITDLPMDSADSPKPARNAKAWIIIIAIVLMVTPFIVLALRKNPAPAPMVWIPGGEFTMGSDKADEKHAEEAPGHAVIVKGFWMDVTEVTNAQFQAFVDATKYITDAEKDLDPRQFPDAPPEMLKGGSLLFKKVSGVNPFQCGGANLPWWNFTAGANWRQPEGQNSSIKERMNLYMVERMGLPEKDVPAMREQYFKMYGTTLRGLRFGFGLFPLGLLSQFQNLRFFKFDSLVFKTALFKMRTNCCGCFNCANNQSGSDDE
mgnify:CR=1 FL=1